MGALRTRRTISSVLLGAVVIGVLISGIAFMLRGADNVAPVNAYPSATTAPGPTPAGTASPAPTLAPTETPVADGLKPLITGLGDRGPYGGGAAEVLIPPVAYRPAVNYVSVSLRWRDLQPRSYRDLDVSTIEAALADVRAFDPTGGTKVRLRLLAGDLAPAWLDWALGTVTMRDGNFDKAGTIPKWWEPAMATYYANLQAKLAARYDDPAAAGASRYADLVGEVTVSMTSDFYPEPLLRHLSPVNSAGLANQTALRMAGYTRTKDIAAVTASINAHRVWRKTRSNFAFNPYQWLEFDASRSRVTASNYGDMPQTKIFIDYFRNALGARAVLANDSLRPSFLTSGAYAEMYRYMVNHPVPGPISFQTEVGAPGKLTYEELKQVVEWALAINNTPSSPNQITSLELTEQMYYTRPPYVLSELTSLNRRLKQSLTPPATAPARG